MNDLERNAFEFSQRAHRYYANQYDFNEQALTNLAKAGLDARLKLNEAIVIINNLVSEITTLRTELSDKDSQ